MMSTALIYFCSAWQRNDTAEWHQKLSTKKTERAQEEVDTTKGISAHHLWIVHGQKKVRRQFKKFLHLQLKDNW